MTSAGTPLLPARPAIHDSALSLIGGTPLVRLDRIAREEGLECNLLAKVEGFSAGGSVKVSLGTTSSVYGRSRIDVRNAACEQDRIAKRMVEEAERKGVLVPGHSILVEPSESGVSDAQRLDAVSLADAAQDRMLTTSLSCSQPAATLASDLPSSRRSRVTAALSSW